MGRPTQVCPSHDTQLYFDRLSETWAQKYTNAGSMRGRLKGIAEKVKAWVPKGARVLDFGCGTGDIAAHCGASGFKVDAVDLSLKMIERAKSRFESQNIQFAACIDPLILPFPDGTFDGIVASSVFEYVVSLQPQLEELRRISKDGGRMLLTVPNMSHPLRWIEAVEKLFLVPFEGSLPRSFRERGEYLTRSVNRFTVPRWTQCLMRAGWHVLSMDQRDAPLLLIVAERGAIDAGNHSKSK
jgi:ubiquinone/menaquinone biosynthesis C-methylase UbiE